MTATELVRKIMLKVFSFPWLVFVQKGVKKETRDR